MTSSRLVVAERAEVRVLLVAPHRLVRVGIRTVLESVPTIEVVAEAASPRDARAILRRRTPSVAVVGPCGPGMDLVETVRAINSSREGGQVSIVALTDEQTDEKGIAAMLEAGVRGLLRQGCEDGELLRVVEAVAAGGVVFTPEVTDRLVRWYVQCTCRATAAPPPAVAMLTPRELDVLRLVGVGLANTQIAEELVLEVSTVKSHIYHVMKKLGLSDRAKAVVFAHKFGLVRHSRPVAVLPPYGAPPAMD